MLISILLKNALGYFANSQSIYFSYLLKIGKVTPIYKAGDNSNISYYRPISVRNCFSKIPERLMYNHLYKYLKENKILYEEQFGFQSGHSTNDAIAQFVDKIFNSFEKEQFTLGVFIDLSKAFGTVDDSILLKKRMKLYGITDKNFARLFYCCVGTKAPPAAKMPWGYLSLKNNMYS